MTALAFETDSGAGTRGTLGVIVLKTDETIEHDFRFFLPSDGVAVYHSRIPFEPEVTSETLARMEHDLAESVALFPETAAFDVIGYGCTSASAVIGEARIAERVNEVHPKAAVTNPLSATKAAFKTLGVKRIALVTPYVREVSQKMRDRFEESGIETKTLASFEQIEDAVVARITPDSIFDAVIKTASQSEVDAVFVACTSLRTAKVIRRAEDTLGIPVLSSNQAMAWHMMRLAGLSDAPVALGRLGSV